MSADPALERAAAQVAAVQSGEAARPDVEAFFDETSFTFSYLVSDPASGAAAIVDSLLDYEPACASIATRSAEALLARVEAQHLKVEWLLETHVHADHLSAAGWLNARLGAPVAIGAGVGAVQHNFAEAFNLDGFACDGSQFGRLFGDGEAFTVGGVPAVALDVSGHTAADTAYLVGDALFVGDTLFMPDYGTARTDFPGADAGALYCSIRRLLSLPGDTRIFLCHDYKAPGRDAFCWETDVAAQRAANVHIRDGVTEEEFVALRLGRDRALATPALLLPAVQVNIRAGRLPEPEANGRRYLKLPLGGKGAEGW
ncbi:MAG: MBL fold metallo-hydrolase [Sphingosinicella sp.]